MHVLAAHAVSGCDTTSSMWGIGKGKVLKVLQSGQHLAKLGGQRFSMQEIIKEATSFAAACYGVKESQEMSTVRSQV